MNPKDILESVELKWIGKLLSREEQWKNAILKGILGLSSLIQCDLVITTDAHTSIVVTKNNIPISVGNNVLHFGDKVKIAATYDENFSINTLTVNGKTITNGSEIEVNNDIFIVATAKTLVNYPTDFSPSQFVVEENVVEGFSAPIALLNELIGNVETLLVDLEINGDTYDNTEFEVFEEEEIVSFYPNDYSSAAIEVEGQTVQGFTADIEVVPALEEVQELIIDININNTDYEAVIMEEVK